MKANGLTLFSFLPLHHLLGCTTVAFIFLFTFPVKATASLDEHLRAGIRGVNLFYLDGRDQEDLPQVIQKLADGDHACKGTNKEIKARLHNTLKAAKDAGFNWIRLLIGRGFYQIYSSRCQYSMTAIYPEFPTAQASAINKLLHEISTYGFTVELVLGGSDRFSDTSNDIIFFESVLTQLDHSSIGMVMLGGDVQPARVKRHADWLTAVYRHFTRHPTNLKTLNYSFDTVTYQNTQDLKDYVNWTLTHLPDIPVIAINLYNRSVPPGADWQAYSKAIAPFLAAYQSVANYKPAWVDEYGFRLSNPGEDVLYTTKDQLAYFKGFTHATRCSTTLTMATFAWTIGNDRYIADPSKDFKNTPFGLFAGYKQNMPVVQPAWQWLSGANQDNDICEALE